MNVKDLATRTRKELLVIAKQLKLGGVSRLRKEDLLDRINAALASCSRKGTSETATIPPPSAKKSKRTTPTPPRRSLPISPVAISAQSETYSTAGLADQAGQAVTETVGVQVEQPTIDIEAPVAQPRQETEDSVDKKFFLGPQPNGAVSEPTALPASYNDNRIVLLARDPHWLYAYWDFSGEHFSKVRNQLGVTDAPLVLRVFDVTYVEFNGANAWSSVDVELTPFATNWYISVPQADAAYCAEIGYRSPDNQFVPLGRSNVVTTPRANVSPITTVRWFTPPERRTISQDAHSPHSRFAQARSPEASAPERGAVQPAPSSAEHPFSWGAARKP